jgi:nucleotide-binding universal stress UspA family protein
MYNRILVPIDGSKPADKALDHTIELVKSISNDISEKKIKIQLMILFVIPNLPVPLGFEKPMRSAKSGEMVSLSDYIKEMHEAMKENALKILSEKKKNMNLMPAITQL